MKNFISENISYLVKKLGCSQDDFGILFDLKKGVINQYIKGNSLPKIETIQKICSHFNISIDDFINNELSEKAYESSTNKNIVTEPSGEYKQLLEAQRETIETQKILIDTLRTQLGQAS